MTKSTGTPTGTEISNHFLHDALDFEQRYKYCSQTDQFDFFASKSKRAKMFTDLRMGVESVLKALVCYFLHEGRTGKQLVNWIEKHGHKLDKMWVKLSSNLPEDLYSKYSTDIALMDQLPVGLRYRYDTWSFRGSKQDLYYQTVGSDVWLDKMHDALVDLTKFANQNLKSHSRIVSLADITEEMFGERYQKYS